MAKRNKPDVMIQDWLALKPYKNYDSYDVHYLKLAQDLHQELEYLYTLLPAFGIEDDSRVPELSCLIASYYEDFISEIGIWNAFTAYNVAEYGHAIPPFQNQEYDQEYINPEDFAFLIWHFVATLSEHLIQPDFNFFMDMGHVLYDKLEPKIEDFTTTDYYDNYLRIASKADFKTIHKKLEWLSEKSYLFGWARSVQFDRKLLVNFEDQVAQGEEFSVEAFARIKHDFLSTPSNFGGLFPAQWLSRIVHADEPTKQSIEQLQAMHNGLYTLEKVQDSSLLFKHRSTQREYWVYPSSLTQKPMVQNTDLLYELLLVHWKDQWHSYGTDLILSKNDSSVKDFEDQFQALPHLLSQKEQQVLNEQVTTISYYFEVYFKSPLVVFASHQEALDQLQAFYDFVRPKLHDKVGTVSEQFYSKQPAIISASENMYTGLGLFLSPSGIHLLPAIDQVLTLLRELMPNQQEKIERYSALMSYVYVPELIEYLKTLFGESQMEMPFENTEIDGLECLPFLGRYYFSETFKRFHPLPHWSSL